MKKNASKEMKPVTKNISADKKKPGPGRGGSRANAGRKKVFETQAMNFDCPVELVKGIEVVKIENKTAYINRLIAADLKTRKLPATLRKSVEAILKTLTEKNKE
jgi:hypothetical protein